MTGTWSRACLTVACCVLAGCRDDRPAAGRAEITADSVAGDSIFDPSEERVNLPSSRIYYTLTSYDWYARGEPLVHDGLPYHLDGMPVDASLAEMTRVGDFRGVEYYRHERSRDTAPSVYVPVFEGYWQRFRADPSAVATPAHAADSVAADTGTVHD